MPRPSLRSLPQPSRVGPFDSMHFASVAALVLGVELYDFVGWTLYPIILNRFCEMVAFMCLRGQHPTTFSALHVMLSLLSTAIITTTGPATIAELQICLTCAAIFIFAILTLARTVELRERFADERAQVEAALAPRADEHTDGRRGPASVPAVVQGVLVALPDGHHCVGIGGRDGFRLFKQLPLPDRRRAQRPHVMLRAAEQRDGVPVTRDTLQGRPGESPQEGLRTPRQQGGMPQQPWRAQLPDAPQRGPRDEPRDLPQHTSRHMHFGPAARTVASAPPSIHFAPDGDYP